MAAKKKPVKKSGPSTGGKVTSRVRDEDSGNKKVPVTSVTPKATTPKPSTKRVAGTRKVVGAIAAATPAGRAGRAAATTVKKTSDAYALGKIQMLGKEMSDIIRGSGGGKNLTESQRKKYLRLSKEYNKLNMKFVDK